MSAWFNRKSMVATLAAGLYSLAAYGADKEPVGRKIDNAQVMDRVQLVGVIAGDAAKNGIAVIRDAQTGKTYAIKTGDGLPGVGHIKLQSVKRELAVFMAEGKEFHVRLAVGGYSQQAEDEQDLAADLNKSTGPGLFEKWYGNQLGEGAGLVDSGQSDAESQNAASTRKAPAQMVLGTKPVETQDKAAEPSEESARLREDRDGPLNEYLRGMTRPQNRKTSRDNPVNDPDRPKSISADQDIPVAE